MRWDPSFAREFSFGMAALLIPAFSAAAVFHVATVLGTDDLLARGFAACWLLAQGMMLAVPFGRPGGFCLRKERVFVYEGVVGVLMLGGLPVLLLADMGALFTLAPILGGSILALFQRYFFPEADHVRGRRLLSSPEAKARAMHCVPRNACGLPWGGLQIPRSMAPLHFLTVGASGSGKTLTIRMLVGELLTEFGTGSGRRAIVYDAKRDAVSTVAGMKPGCPVKILNPFDKRSTRWAIAKDATTPAVCLQIAESLVHAEPGPNQFFSLAGIEILAGVLVALHLSAPGRWDLRDVILATRDPERLRSLLESHLETAGPLIHFAEPRTLANILSTVRVRMAQLEPIAAAWARADDEVSLEEWATGEMILLLGNDETTRVCLDALNRVMLRRSVELVLNGPEIEGWRTLYVLDEVAQMGRLDCLSPLLTKGRSKGASVVLGFQDMDGLRAVYEKSADELVGQCGTKALLRVESPATAEWESRTIGEAEEVEHQVTTSNGGGSTTHQKVKREAVLPSEFLSLPPATRDEGVTGYFVIPQIGAFRGVVTPSVLRKHLREKTAGVPDFIPRSADDQYLRPWTTDDLQRLGEVRAKTDPERRVGDGAAALKQLRILRHVET